MKKELEQINWTKIDIDNIPTEEVVATNNGSQFIFNGNLFKARGKVHCDTGDGGCPIVTHYILSSELLNLPKL